MSKSTLNIIGLFDDQDKLLGSIKKIQDKGFRVSDVISPYPIHEVFHALKLKTKMPIASLLYGVFAVLVTFGFLYWTSVVDYPLRFGGKPQNTLSFVVVIFIMTINITALLTIVTFFLREKKGPGAKFDSVKDTLTDDQFAVLIDKTEEMNEKVVETINELLQESGAVEVFEKDVKHY